MNIKSRVENLEKKYNISQNEIIVFITRHFVSWETGKDIHSKETLNPKELLIWQNECKKRIEGKISKQRAEGNKFIVVVDVPYKYPSQD